MTIKLKPEQEKFIEAQVASGKYDSPEEVMDKMFLVFERLQSEYDEWIVETRKKVDVATEEIKRGEGLDGETVIAELLERFKKAREAN
jgi:antitoxin ParD1/3/4